MLLLRSADLRQIEKTLLSDSSNNELLIINLATVQADGNSKIRPA
jgi:hypothetical protein